MVSFWGDGTTTTTTTTTAVLLLVLIAVVHGRFVGWVTYVGGLWMGRWVVLYLRAQPGGWMGGVGLVHRLWVSECVGIL